MINILSCVGMSLQSEVCVWTLMGLVRTIVDATQFRVDADLTQVWQMEMPKELTLPVQRALCTLISGVMLVQCFTVYVYIASYIILLYPVFLEERPILVLPWLLLAAVRKLLCELMSLAMGLGTCVLLGPARTPCVKFVIKKLATIAPAVYMWMLLLSYYKVLKIASSFKTFPMALASSDHDYGLELAVRRRRTKSLLNENELRKRLTLNFVTSAVETTSRNENMLKHDKVFSDPKESLEEINVNNFNNHFSITPQKLFLDMCGNEEGIAVDVTTPRDSDRILEQIVIMMVKIAAYLKTKGNAADNLIDQYSQENNSIENINNCSNLQTLESETPPVVASNIGKVASYLKLYPNIFKKQSKETFRLPLSTQSNYNIMYRKTIIKEIKNEKDKDGNIIRMTRKTVSIAPNEIVCLEIKKTITRKKITDSQNNKTQKSEDSRKLVNNGSDGCPSCCNERKEHQSRNVNCRKKLINNLKLNYNQNRDSQAKTSNSLNSNDTKDTAYEEDSKVFSQSHEICDENNILNKKGHSSKSSCQ